MDVITCVDIGNQNLKFATFNTHGELLDHNSISNSETLNVLSGLKNETKSPIIVSDVSGKSDSFNPDSQVHCINYNYQFPFTINYKTPDTIGVDRLCGLSGASFISPDTNCLVFNLGTCLTIDFVNNNGIYDGGNISPGLALRYKSIHKFTAKLPLVKPNEHFDVVGIDTESAILNGVQNGILAEIEYYISHFSKYSGKINVFLTGGDAVYFVGKMKIKIFNTPYLNLFGLFNIAKINGII